MTAIFTHRIVYFRVYFVSYSSCTSSKFAWKLVATVACVINNTHALFVVLVVCDVHTCLLTSDPPRRWSLDAVTRVVLRSEHSAY
jgi:hypothetical protein